MAGKIHRLIAICGMDGSGKSALARALAERLRTRGSAVRLLHAHAYAASASSFGLSEDSIRRRRRLLRLLLPLAYLDSLFLYLTSYRPRKRGEIVVLDRYFYDKLARMMYFGICGERIAAGWARWLPRPGALFILDAPEEVIARRKADYPLEELRRFRRAYRFLAGALGAPVIDTSQPFERCLETILAALFPGEPNATER